jgi:uncharacterized membrane protein
MARTIYGVFKDASHADAAVSELLANGFINKDLSVVTRDTQSRSATRVDGDDDEVGEGAASGAVTGGVLGAIGGLLVGVGAIVLPPIGGIFIAGPLAAALGISTAAASTIAGGGLGALGGGLIGGLVNLGIPEEDARIYEETITNNGTLLSVQCDSEAEEMTANEIFSKHMAENVRTV